METQPQNNWEAVVVHMQMRGNNDQILAFAFDKLKVQDAEAHIAHVMYVGMTERGLEASDIEDFNVLDFPEDYPTEAEALEMARAYMESLGHRLSGGSFH